MRARFGWLFVGMMACTGTGASQDPGGPPPASTPEVAPEKLPASAPTPPESTSPPATPDMVTVEMTAATLADDCGGPPPASKKKAKSVPGKKEDMARARAKRACEQSSMQLSVVAGADSAPSQLSVKKVELFDDKGAMIGELTASTPTVWDESGAYQAWDQSVAPGQELSVSYQLSQPPWDDVSGRRSRTYVLKAVIAIGDGEQAVRRDVQVSAPTSLPPNVKT